MSRISTNNIQPSLSADGLAVRTNFLDRCFDSHLRFCYERSELQNLRPCEISLCEGAEGAFHRVK